MINLRSEIHFLICILLYQIILQNNRHRIQVCDTDIDNIHAIIDSDYIWVFTFVFRFTLGAFLSNDLHRHPIPRCQF